MIQKQLGFSDRELVEEIRENQYFQFFIGLPGCQDVNLLNEARENLEHIIDTHCHELNCNKHHMYRKNARRDYLNLAKTKKRTGKRIRKAIKQQFQYIRRDLVEQQQYILLCITTLPFE